MRMLALGALAALLLAGCGSPHSSQQTLEANGAAVVTADDSVFYRVGGGDFPVETSPAEVARREEYVVLGTVAGFEDGRSESFTYRDGITEVDRFVVVRVMVDEVLKGDQKDFESGYAFLIRPRGVESFDAKGDPIEGGNATIPMEAFARSVPVGARVLVMASRDRGNAEEGVEVVNPGAGVPDTQAPLLSIYNPQTLLLDGGPESTLRGWQGVRTFTFTSALDEVRSAVGAPAR